MIWFKFSYFFMLLILGSSCSHYSKSNYNPVTCHSSKPYSGKPLYSGAIDWEFDTFSIGDQFHETIQLNLNKELKNALKYTKSETISASIISQEGRWANSVSLNDNISELGSFHWASVGKAFTAIVIMQLVNEGKLSLSDTINKWNIQVPHAEVISVDHVLTHTSGLFSYNEDLVVRKENKYLAPQEVFTIARKHGAMFCPGEYWRYSNTGYTILGQIIEEIDQNPFHQSIMKRIIQPFNLDETNGLKSLPPPADPSNEDYSDSWAYAAGNIVGSAESMGQFWYLFISGQIIDRKLAQRFFAKLYPMFDEGTYYGRGVMLYSINDGTELWLGHSGGTQNVKAVVAFDIKRRAVVAVTIKGEGSAEATAYLLLNQLGSIE